MWALRDFKLAYKKISNHCWYVA